MPIAPSKTGSATFIAAYCVLATGCSLKPHQNWSFTHPPTVNDGPITLEKPATGSVWCRTLSNAQAMAVSGFFMPDCTNTTPSVQCTVTAISTFRFGTVATKIATCESSEIRYWIPLPKHNWA